MQSERSEPIAQDNSQQSLGHEYCDEQPAKNEPDDHLEKQAIPVMHDQLDMELKASKTDTEWNNLRSARKYTLIGMMLRNALV